MPRLSFLSSRSQRRAAVSNAALEALEDRRLLSVSVVSVVNGGTGLGNGTSREPSVSADGRFVVFSSSASNLVTGDANNAADVFLRDTTTNTTTLISVNSAGNAAGNAASDEPSISADGRFVSFTSAASDLVSGDTNTFTDIFVRDVQAGTTKRVSADATGPNFTGNPNGFSAEPFTSANGDFVAFTSRADDMVTGVTDRADASSPVGPTKVTDVFLRDLTNNNPATAIKMVSVNTSGNVSGNARSFDASVSADGRFVAFRSEASDLVAGDNNGKRDIFVRDMQLGVTTRVSVVTGGGESNGNSDSPSISQDGRFIVFSSNATNLVGNDGNGDVSDVFLHDTQTGTTTLISTNQLRTSSGNALSFEPTISQEGRFVAFTSGASDLVTGDNNNSTDIFLYDKDTGALNLISTNTAGAPAQGNSRDAFVAPGGQFIAFSSEAIDLVGGDNNGASDAFLATAPNRTADTQAPTATVAQADQPSNFIGADHLDFTVNYNDNDALNLNSFGDGDVEVTGPGITTPVAATLVSKLGSGKTVKVTYRIAPPGGTVGEANNGAYTITLRSGQVEDAAGNAAAPGAIGQVNVTAVPAEGPDIVVTIPGTLLPAVGGFKGKQKVLLQNTGTQAITTKSKITVGLFLSTDSLLDPSDTVIATKLLRFNAKPNAKPKNVAFKFVWPRPGGTNTGFQLLAAADTTNVVPERSEQNNVAASPVTVADPFVDLSGSLGAIPTALAAGQRVKLPFTIQNNGNVPAKGSISLKLLASADDQLGAGDTEIVTLLKKINLRPGKPKLLPLSFVMPSTIAAGTYTLLVQIDSGNTITETNEVNNVAVSSTTFTVG